MKHGARASPVAACREHSWACEVILRLLTTFGTVQPREDKVDVYENVIALQPYDAGDHGGDAPREEGQGTGEGDGGERGEQAVLGKLADGAGRELPPGGGDHRASKASVASQFEPEGEVAYGARAELKRRHVHSCRFLVSLYTLDTLSLVVGRTMLFEALWMASELGYSIVFLALVMASIETLVEFFSSSITSYVYSKFFGPHLRACNLARFALAMYTASNAVALIVYPVLGVVIYVLDVKNLGTLVALMAAQTIQYPLINQVGDQAVEMALPHWLKTFEGTRLVFPGFPWCCRCCCCRRGRSQFHYNVQSHANSNSLSLFLALVRYALSSVAAIVYIAIRSHVVLRWAFVLLVGATNVLFGWVLNRNLGTLTLGIVDEEVDKGKTLNRWPWQLQAFEQSLVMYAVVAFGVPQQAFAAILSLLALRVSSSAAGAVVVFGAIVLFFALGRQMRRVSHEGGENFRFNPMQLNRADDERNTFKLWLWLLWLATALLAGSSALLYFLNGNWQYLCIPLLLPFAALAQLLRARFEGHLFELPDTCSSDVQFWKNVFTVAVNGPLLGVNWLAVGLVDNERKELGMVLAVAVAILVFLCVYYTVFDPRLPTSKGLGANVERVRREFRLRLNQRCEHNQGSVFAMSSLGPQVDQP